MFSVSNPIGGVRKASRGAGYLSILAVGVLACFSQPALGQQPAVNLNYLPDNSQFVANLKLADIMASPAFAAAAQQDPNLAQQLQAMKAALGVDVKDTTHMTFAGVLPGGGATVPDAAVLLQTKVAYTDKQILDNMGKTATPMQVGNFTIQEIKADQAICVVAPTNILVGPTASLKAILQRNGPAMLGAKVQDALKATNFSSTVALVADVKAIKKAIPAGALPGGIPGGGPGGNPFGNINADLPETLSLELSVGQNLVLKGVALFTKAKDAADIAQLAQGILALVRLQAGNVEKELQDALNSIQINAQGNKLTAQGSMSNAALLKLMKQGMANPFGGPKPPAPVPQDRAAPPAGPAAPPAIVPPGPGPAPVAPAPAVAVQPAAQTFNENGSFSKSLTINPNQSFTFNVACQANQPATFTIKPQIDAKLDIRVYQNGVLVAQDVNGPIKTNFALNWNSTAGNCQVQVVSTDNIVNTCTFSFNQGGGVVQPAPAGVIQKNGPFSEVLTIKPNDNFTYQFPVQNGPATFTIKPQQDAILNVKVFQNGVQVAQDLNGGVKTNFVLTWNAQAGANVQVQIQSTDNLTNQCTLSFAQAGGGVGPVGVINKTGAFSELQSIKPNDQFTYQFPVVAGQATVTIKPQFDAKLDVQVLQNGVVVAQDVNGPIKTNFNLTWNAQAGNATLSIKSTDNIVNNCTISFLAQAGGGVGVVPGVIQKNGPFTDNLSIKPNDKYTYQFPVNAGPATFNIKPQFDAILTVQVMQNGVVVAQDNGLKTVFNLNWNAQAGNATVNITSTDNLTNNCTVSFNQGPVGVIPPPPGGGAPSVNGNCPAGGTTQHSTDLKAGTQYTITLNTLTNGYDPYLWLYDPNGQLVAQDDDSGGFPNAKIVYTPTVNGKFQLKCGSFGMASGGMYQLAINNGALITAAGGGVAPPPPGGVIQKNGPFTEQQNIGVGAQFTYQFPAQNGQYTLTIKPQFDAKLDVQVLQNNVLVVQDTNGPIKTNFSLNWNGQAGAIVQVKIKSTDNIANQCTITVAQGGGVVPPPPPGNVINKPGPFTEVQNIGVGAQFSYSFPVQAGQATFTIKPQFDAKLDVQVIQNGVVVAQDTNGPIKTNFNLVWNAQAGNATVTIKSTDNIANQCTLTFAQAGGFPPPPPPPGGVIQKNGPFSEGQNIKPNDQFTYQFPVQNGQATFTIKPQFDAKLDVQVFQNGVVVAQDVNGPIKTVFNFTWNGQAGSQVQVKIKSTDNIANQCTLTFAQGGGFPPPPPPPGGKAPNGEVVNIKPNDDLSYQFPVNAGQATFTIKPQFDAKLDVQIFQNGVVVAQDVNGPIKTVFNFTWNGQAGAQVQIKIKSTDNIANNCTLTFSQGGGVPPPPGGGAASVNGNCPVSGTTTHTTDLKAGTQYIITLNTLTNGYDPYLWLYDPNGQLVAQDDDSGGFPNAKIVYTPVVNGKFQLKVGSFANASGGQYQLAINNGALITGAGAVPPPPPPPIPGGVIQKNGPFSEVQSIKPNDKFTYSFPVNAGQATFTIKPQFDAILNVQVLQNGVVVASDQNGGVKTNFVLNWNAQAGNATVVITSTDNLTNQCTISFAQAGGIAPPPPGVGKAPAGETVNIKPNDQLNYQFPVNAGQATFTIKPQFDAKLDVQIFQNGVVVAQDVNGPIKTNFVLTWNAQAGNVSVSIKSTDNIANNCTLTFTQGGGFPPPKGEVLFEDSITEDVAASLVQGGPINKPGPFSEVQSIKPNDKIIYQVKVGAGASTLKIKPEFDAILNVKVLQNGVELAKDLNGGVKKEFVLNFNLAAGEATIEIVSTDNLTNKCTITFSQGNDPVPPPVGGTPSVKGNCPVSGTTMHSTELKAGTQYTITLNTLTNGYDPYLWLYDPTGQLVAQDDDSGGFPNAKIVYTPTVNGKFQLKVGSFANGSGGMYELAINNGALIGGGPLPPPPPGGVIKKPGPFSDNLNIKPNDKYTYQITVAAGAATLTIKPQFDAILNVKVMQNGVVLAMDMNGGVKKNFSLPFNAAAGEVTVEIVSPDTLTNQCTVTFAQGGVAPPPPPMGGAASVKGNCPNGGMTTHTTELKAGTQYTITLNTLTNGYDPYLYLYDPAGNLVAQDDDSGGFPNSKIVYTPTVNGKFQLKCGSFQNASGGQYELAINNGALIAGAPAPPAPGGIIKKAGAFTDQLNIKPNDKFTYQITVGAGQSTLNIKPQFDAILNVKVTQNGTVLAQDMNGGVKQNFVLNFNAAVGDVTVEINSADTLTNNCTVTFSQAGGKDKEKN